jgi:hypothetical protein
VTIEVCRLTNIIEIRLQLKYRVLKQRYLIKILLKKLVTSLYDDPSQTFKALLITCLTGLLIY